MEIGVWRGIGTIVAASPFWKWVLRLGGPGLIVVGLIDNSVIPIPGGMDVFLILLTAHHPQWWPYYGAMATAGAVIGGYVTYRLAGEGGKAELEKKIGKRRAEKIYEEFEKGGFSTVFVGSILPPPFTMVPVLMAAGVLQYARRSFLAAVLGLKSGVGCIGKPPAGGQNPPLPPGVGLRQNWQRSAAR